MRPISRWKHSPRAGASLGGGGGGSQGGDLTLNSLLRTWWSLKHSLSCRAFKQLECMANSRVSFWWTWMFLSVYPSVFCFSICFYLSIYRSIDRLYCFVCPFDRFLYCFKTTLRLFSYNFYTVFAFLHTILDVFS